MQFALILLWLATVTACRRSEGPSQENVKNSSFVSMRTTDSGFQLPNEARKRSPSLFDDLREIQESSAHETEAAKRSRAYLLNIANQRGLSLPRLIAEELEQLFPNPADPAQLNRFPGLCNGQRDEMIELIQILPTGPLRNIAVNTYGGNWAAERDLEAIRQCYDLIPAGSNRTVLASLGSRAAYLSSNSDEALAWIESLEFPEEKRIAIDQVNSMFLQGLGNPADRPGFLKRLQNIATANGLPPPTGKRGEPLPPMKRGPLQPAEPSTK